MWIPNSNNPRCARTEAAVRLFRTGRRHVAYWVMAALGLARSPAVASPPGAPDFERTVAPIVNARCLSCHGARGMGGLDLRTASGAIKGGSTGPAVVRNEPDKSLIVQRITNGSMPPGGPKLSDTEIKTVRTWIADGAQSEVRAVSALEAGKRHWAFRPPVRPNVPAVNERSWVRTPIDAFILAKLEKAGVAPPPRADKRTLLRRVYLDLIGLPPTPEEQSAFLNDRFARAYERVVDDLLSRPQYGERWARHWLDVARYAETNGYERDTAKPSAWRYRDYAIDAFNSDKPFDRFVEEQIAGDELPGSNAETQIAASFLRVGSWDDEPADPAVDRCDQLDDVVGTTATAFLGITLRCARCHDHKFEPFTQRDYYSVVAVFNPLKRPQQDRIEQDLEAGTVTELTAYHRAMAKADADVAAIRPGLDATKAAMRTRLLGSGKTKLPKSAVDALNASPDKRNDAQRDLVEKYSAESEKEIAANATSDERAIIEDLQHRIDAIDKARPQAPPHAYAFEETGSKPPDTFVLFRGDPTRPGPKCDPAVPEVLAHGDCGVAAPAAHTTGRRLWFAKWVASPDNPLTARVIVNRLWQHHFGAGIVASENDFGVMGIRPTHPELLDWLACELTRPSGNSVPWSLKRIQRMIVLSSVYRATSLATPNVLESDPENRLYSRWKPRRLEAEAVRDSILAVTGNLNLQRGGPSIYPPLAQEVLQGQSRPGDGWGHSDARQAARRSVYIFSKRSLAVPELETLDTPDTSSSCERRQTSIVAPQALTFLNGAFAREQAHALADRLRREAGTSQTAQITRGFELTFCRPPSSEESRTSLAFLAKQTAQIQQDGPKSVDPASWALDEFCLVLLNSNEFFYLN